MKKYLYLATTVGLSGVLLLLLCLWLASGAPSVQGFYDEASAGTPDLIIDVQTADETISAGQVISYVIMYSNTLSQPLQDVVISSTVSYKQYYSGTYLSDPVIVPANFSYVGNFDDGYVLEWQLGSLSAYESGWIFITTTVPLEAEPPWRDQDQWPLLGCSAAITTSTPGVSTGNPQGLEGDSVSVMVVGPVLQITKVCEPIIVRPGRLLTCTLTVQNKDRNDAIAAHGLVITDLVPANTVFHSASGTGVYSSTTGLVTWHPPDPLERGDTLIVHFTVRLLESMPDCSMTKFFNESYGVRSDETIRIVTNKRVAIYLDDVLEKTIETPDPPPGIYEVFPGRIVTYTISIYNPRHDQAVTGLRVTDTLPGEPNLFTFVDMVDGPTPVITSPAVVWENLTLSAGGVLSFSFHAWVPYHIDVGKKARTYVNEVSASAPGLVICDMKNQIPSKARVTRQIELDKTVDPDHVISGGVVTYTITLENVGDTLISGIRLTDTLPHEDGADFYYLEMVNGPEPVYTQSNLVVWDGLSVPTSSVQAISFKAVAIGLFPECYKNDLAATSPDTTIPPRTKKAEVCMDLPLEVIKTVTPEETFVGESVTYALTIRNVSTDTSYTFDRLRDYLPTGFYVSGTNPLDVILSPPVTLAPGESWFYNFEADVTTDVGCENLPDSFPNATGAIQVHLTNPTTDWWILNDT